ncbi:hypothetical protein D9758_009521 [Tetrapyrgos nigripes]|uniref:F-box domain-containing protein n=1 Tax=Tetrapyrgos nigripes TaxID=182062 RepID=A0A8H5G135_9AGAR|nr:hypothetical protein D9758_009521 [Tetrapyrgos nigripes]
MMRLILLTRAARPTLLTTLIYINFLESVHRPESVYGSKRSQNYRLGDWLARAREERCFVSQFSRERIRAPGSPSSPEHTQLSQIVAEAEKDLSDYEEDLRCLDIVSDLRKKRDDLQTYVDDCKAYLSPIRQLPTEILGEIFLYYQDLHGTCKDGRFREPINDPVHSAQDLTALMLSSVSKLWHSICLFTPDLSLPVEANATLLRYSHRWFSTSWELCGMDEETVTCLGVQKDLPLLQYIAFSWSEVHFLRASNLFGDVGVVEFLTKLAGLAGQCRALHSLEVQFEEEYHEPVQLECTIRLDTLEYLCLDKVSWGPVNAFNEELWRAYGELFEKLAEEAHDVRAVVVSFAFPKFFTARLDLNAAKSVGSTNTDPARIALSLKKHIQEFQYAIHTPERCDFPVIAAIHASNARFSIKEVDIGLAADIGTLVYLFKITGNRGEWEPFGRIKSRLMIMVRARSPTKFMNLTLLRARFPLCISPLHLPAPPHVYTLFFSAVLVKNTTFLNNFIPPGQNGTTERTWKVNSCTTIAMTVSDVDEQLRNRTTECNWMSDNFSNLKPDAGRLEGNQVLILNSRHEELGPVDLSGRLTRRTVTLLSSTSTFSRKSVHRRESLRLNEISDLSFGRLPGESFHCFVSQALFHQEPEARDQQNSKMLWQRTSPFEPRVPNIDLEFSRERIRTPGSPSSLEHTQISQIVAEAEKGLSDYEEDLCCLDSIVSDLRKKRDDLKKYVDDCKAYFSPIRQLPTEIMGEIFLFYQDLHGTRLDGRFREPINDLYHSAQDLTDGLDAQLSVQTMAQHLPLYASALVALFTGPGPI